MTVAHRNLRRLEPQAYRGLTAVHWTFSLEDRVVGWLNAEFHNHFREVLTHMGLRYGCVVPTYCLMPNHIHIIMLGFRENADLYLAARFLRKNTAKALLPARYQKQAYDHVLDEKESDRGFLKRSAFTFWKTPFGESCANGQKITLLAEVSFRAIPV